MDYRTFFKGQFISAAEFGGKDVTLTITGAKLAKLEQDTGTMKDRGVISFKETDRGWVLNRTNAECLAGMWGRDTDGWIGKRVTLYATDVKFGGKSEIGIRVKGSPDLTAPVEVEVKLPRKRPVKMRMLPTGRAQAATATEVAGEVQP